MDIIKPKIMYECIIENNDFRFNNYLVLKHYDNHCVIDYDGEKKNISYEGINKDCSIFFTDLKILEKELNRLNNLILKKYKKNNEVIEKIKDLIN